MNEWNNQTPDTSDETKTNESSSYTFDLTNQSETPPRDPFSPFKPYSEETVKADEKVFTPQTTYTSYMNGYESKDNKSDKKKKPLTITTVIIASIVTSVVVGLISSFLTVNFMQGGFSLLYSSGNNDKSTVSSNTNSSNDSSVKNIVIDATSETAAIAVAEKVSPSVVGISVVFQNYSYFYGSSEAESYGSGIVYNKDGYIITNYHVIEAGVTSRGSINVYLYNDLETGIPATVIGYDVGADLAIIKIDKSGLVPIEIGNSDEIKVGQTAVAVGNPGGMEFYGSVTMGIISGLDRTIELESSSSITLIQTDTAINPGNSGGALTDSQGKLIGVNSAKLSGDGYESMGFAIPVNDVVEISNRIISKKDSPKPYLGIAFSEYYTASLLQQYGFPAGVVVETVASGSPADECGIMRGDIITQFNSVNVTSIAALNSEKEKYNPGDQITLTVYRNRQSYTVKLTLGYANN